MRVLDIFSGIGGFSLGLERAGMKTVRFIEIDPFCRRVLAKHWPDVPCDEDVTTAEFKEGEADVICGGFPCQDISRAGHRAGITGTNSGLYRELVRAIRVVRPKFSILENVAALLGNGMGDVCRDLAESGYNLEWDCVPACALGAPHQRDRIWIVAHAASEQMGSTGQPWQRPGVGENVAHAQSIGCGERWPRGFTDSFSGIRNQARGNLANADCAGLENGNADAARHAQPEFTGKNGKNCWETWPDEPALCGVDDGIPCLVERVKALGNSLIPQIPEIIGRAIMDSLK